MEHNVGTLDRIIRAVAAVAFLAIAYFYDIWWLYLIAAAIIFTLINAHCPAYSLFHISTRKEK